MIMTMMFLMVMIIMIDWLHYDHEMQLYLIFVIMTMNPRPT